MEVKILKSTDDIMLIGWQDESGFGEILLKYAEGGQYSIDAEFIGIPKLLKIMKAVAESDGKQVIKLEDDEGEINPKKD